MAYYAWKPYVPVAKRRQEAARHVQKLAKKGQAVTPVIVEGRTIAKTFWGKSWCENLERYSDYENRLPRGRTYVRNGSVVDLKIACGEIKALVSGSEIYTVKIVIEPTSSSVWKALCSDCAGSIDSLVELLQGRLSKGVMERVCLRDKGLFPSPKQIKLNCSCPDWADMCKHVAAVLYGVGARLDASPDLLFTLRGVDKSDLVANAGEGLTASKKPSSSKRVMTGGDLGAIFGVEMAEAGGAGGPAPKAPAKKLKGKASTKAPAKAKAGAVPPTAAPGKSAKSKSARTPEQAKSAPPRPASKPNPTTRTAPARKPPAAKSAARAPAKRQAAAAKASQSAASSKTAKNAAASKAKGSKWIAREK
jgi:uncharacterized Zn finger protein